MAFDGSCTACVVKELNDRLSGGSIAKIAQPEREEILMTVKCGREMLLLFLSASPSLPLLYITEEKKEAPITAPAFCMLLRKHLQGGRILSVTQPSLERVVTISVEHPDELGDRTVRRLHLELMGKYSNLILTTDDGVILDAIRRVPSSVSSVREVLPGRPYFIPGAGEKLDPLTLTKADFDTYLDQASPSAEVSRLLIGGLTGVSPQLAEELVFRAGLGGGDRLGSLTGPQKDMLFASVSEYFKDVREGNFDPVVYYQSGVPKDFSVIPFRMYGSMDEKPFRSVSRLLSVYYAEKNRQGVKKQKSATLRHLTQTALSRAVRKLDLQEKQMRDTDKMDTLRLYGELLMALGHSVVSGSKTAELVNYYDGKTVKIPLDEALSAQGNAQKYFARYDKMKRTRASLTIQLAETRQEVETLDSILTSLDIAENEADLAVLRSELENGGWAKRTGGNAKGKIRPTRSKPMCYRLTSGLCAYVGKNNLQNEELSMKTAAASDWWFHAKNLPGSHVIVRANGQNLSDLDYEEAASLAAHYSKAGKAEKVEIDYTQRKHLKKPNASAPGFVIYHTNFSMLAKTDISGLHRIE